MIYTKTFLVALSLVLIFEATAEAQLFRKGASRQQCCSCSNVGAQLPSAAVQTAGCTACSQAISTTSNEHYPGEFTQPVLHEYEVPSSVPFSGSVEFEYASPQPYGIEIGTEVQPQVISDPVSFQVYEELPSSSVVGDSTTFSHVDAVSFEAPTTEVGSCLLYTSPSPRDRTRSRMPSSA